MLITGIYANHMNPVQLHPTVSVVSVVEAADQISKDKVAGKQLNRY